MANTAKLLHLRPASRSVLNPSCTRFFSSSSSSNDDPNPQNANPTSDATSSQPKSSFSSFFGDVKTNLNKQPRPPQHFPSSNKTFTAPGPPSQMASYDELSKKLSGYRIRPASPPPSPLSGSTPPTKHISLVEFYKRDNLSKAGEGNTGDFKLEAARLSLRELNQKIPANENKQPNTWIPQFRNNYRQLDLSTIKPPLVIGGHGPLPEEVFGKELKDEKREVQDDDDELVLLKQYSYEALGNRLRQLRPEKKKDDKNWFTFQELSQRLRKLRAIEEKEMRSGSGAFVADIRKSLMLSGKIQNEKLTRLNTGISVLHQAGQEPDYMLSPPQEHLVEKYFHPDNMSSAEKLKIELKKVRDEFKMSESDCGSARVQVAQLTTKIKHLSTVLHKKDKHSRKGLQAMVQQRKKWLKYLRRTDWDSYCLVLSKLGLRDNPDYKN